MNRISAYLLPIVYLSTLLTTAPSRALAMNVDKERSSDHLHELLKAKTTNELQASIQKKSTLDQARLTCSVQLRGKKIPTSCFTVLRLEKEAGLLTATAEIEELIWLGPLCLTRAKDSHDWHELGEAAHSTALPDACLKAASARDQDLRYSAQSEHADELFARRFE